MGKQKKKRDKIKKIDVFLEALKVLFVNLYYIFFHRLGWFPIQGLRPTCYCISGPRRIPAVGVTRPTPCAHCRTWVYPYQGDASHHTTMDPASLSPPAPHAHGARPLDVKKKNFIEQIEFSRLFKCRYYSSLSYQTAKDILLMLFHKIKRHNTYNFYSFDI